MGVKLEQFVEQNELTLVYRETTTRYIRVTGPEKESWRDSIEWVSDVQVENRWPVRVIKKDGKWEYLEHLLRLRNENRTEARDRAVMAIRGTQLTWVPGERGGKVAPEETLQVPDDLE